MKKTARAPESRKALYAAIAAAIVAVMVQLPARSAPFVFDDIAVVQHNAYLHSRSMTEALSENPYRAAANFTFWFQIKLNSPAPGRVMSLAAAQAGLSQTRDEDGIHTFHTDPVSGKKWPVSIESASGTVFPAIPPAPLRNFNMICHLLCAALIFSIVKKFRQGLAPAFAFSLFALNPLATETINYITARYDLMAMALSLLALRLHFEAEDKPRLDIAAAACYVLALFCKETAAPLPLIAFIIDTLRGRFRPLVLAGLVAAAVYIIARSTWIVMLDSGRTPALPWTQYLILEQWVIWIYAAKSFIPFHLNFDYDIASHAARDIPAAVTNLCLLALSVLVLTKRIVELKAKKSPSPVSPELAAGAFVLIGMAALSPTSSVIPLGDVIRESRAYPLIALLCSFAAIAGRDFFVPLSGVNRKIAATLAAGVLLLFAAGSFRRNLAWSGDLALYRDTMRKSPGKTRVVYNYATALLMHNRLEDSYFWNRVVLAMDPNHDKARYNLILLQKQLGLGIKREDHSAAP